MYGVIMIAAVTLLLLLTANPAPEHTAAAYARELQETEDALARMGSQGDRLDRVRLLYLKACLTGDFSDLQALEREIEAAIAAIGPVEDLVLAKINLDMKLHRLDAAVQSVEAYPHLKESAGGRVLMADLALQAGRYAEARARLEAAVGEHTNWETLARLAYYRARTGEPDAADRLYVRAQDLLTAKDMRHYAWLELQRGIVDLDAGRHHAALMHYRHANRAYSGYWLIEEHMAEVLALLGRYEEAEEYYARVVSATDKPDLLMAYANVVARRDPQRSAALAQNAREGFQKQYARYPQVAVGHYLDFLFERDTDSARLISLARSNLAARPNAEAKLMLARAYLRAGRIEAARSLVAEVEDSPWRPPELAELRNALRSGA
jgi:tetratricopeptide (TPR) repeat protein